MAWNMSGFVFHSECSVDTLDAMISVGIVQTRFSHALSSVIPILIHVCLERGAVQNSE